MIEEVSTRLYPVDFLGFSTDFKIFMDLISIQVRTTHT